MASQALIKDFEDLLGKENVFSSEADRASYSYDSAVLPAVMPALVVRPTTAEQLGQCVKKLYDNGIPMTVRGSGTNLSGGTIPDKSDTVVILTTGLNRILEINSDDLYAVVEPGVITAQFAAAVAKKNLFYPPDPGSQAVSTIGGNIAENAGGLRGLKYGVTKDYFMGVEFFDSTGALVKSGSRTVKCVTGYNLTGLMIQSEGTLGVISQAVLKLVPPPKASRACMAVFPDVQSAAQAVAGIIAAHVLPCTLEFLDNNTIVRVDDFTKAGLPREAGAICSSKWTATPPRWKTTPPLWKKCLRPTALPPCMCPRTPQKSSSSGKPAAWLCPCWRAPGPPPCWKTPPCRAPRFRP